MHERIEELLGQERVGINAARWVLGQATRRMLPDPTLENWWDGYSKVAMAFAGNQAVCAQSMAELRNSLEFTYSDDPGGEELIAASKMILSSILLFTHNPVGSLMFEQDVMHDDIDPLIRKAVWLLEEVSEMEEDGMIVAVVEFDEDRPNRLAQHQEQNKMRYLIENAVRPQNG
jgi:hypothetical protein